MAGITPLALVTRTSAGSPLTQVQFDKNLTDMQTAVNAAITKLELAVADNGDLKAGVVKTLAQIVDGLITVAKLAALAGDDLGGFLRADKSTGAIGPAQLIAQVQSSITGYTLTGPQTAAVIGTLTFSDLPAGNVLVWGRVMAHRNGDDSSNGGAITLLTGSTDIASAATHEVDQTGGNWKALAFFGMLADFAGGDLVVELHYDTGEATCNITFGEDDFGPKVMAFAGL